jgi:manganese/iron transport system ATP-binding protein
MDVKNIARKPVAHEPEAPVVKLTHATVNYADGEPALDNVSLEIRRGEQVAVVGPNGAGKTTLLKVIAGIQEPTSGAADVYGHEASGHICIGYVPQRSQVDWKFPVTVSDVVMMGRTAKMGLFKFPSKTDRRIVREMLEKVGMTDLADRQIGELSGGQQQRVFIARALAQEAELLLMDEPLTGLDMPSQEAIFEILDSLRPEQMTVLVSTHDLRVAADRFDRLMLLRHQLLGFGAPDQVLTAENLQRAYGAHMTMIETPAGTMALSDTCCEGDTEPQDG